MELHNYWDIFDEDKASEQDAPEQKKAPERKKTEVKKMRPDVFIYACRHDDIRIIEHFMNSQSYDAKTRYDIRGSNGRREGVDILVMGIFLACQYGSLKVVKHLTEKYNVKYDFYRAAFITCKYNQLEVLKYLVKRERCIDDDDFLPVFMCACHSGYLDMVKYIVEDIHYSHFSWALYYAREYGQSDIIKYFTEAEEKEHSDVDE